MNILLTTIVISMYLALAASSSIIKVEPVTTSPPIVPLGCHKRIYTYQVVKADSNNRKCWGYVNVAACWGRCDSGEISDWRFPYKRAHHPVCVHAVRQPVSVELNNCDEEADESARHYEYLEAGSCHCNTCSSLDTSCEAPANNILYDKNSFVSFIEADSVSLDY